MARVTREGSKLTIEIGAEEFMMANFYLSSGAYSGLSCIAGLAVDRLKGTQYEEQFSHANTVKGYYRNNKFFVEFEFYPIPEPEKPNS